MSKPVFLDARLSNNSGIGRYIDSLAIEFTKHPEWGYHWSFLINDERQCAGMGERYTTHLRPFSPIWQFQAPLVLPKNNLLWTPHWNHPILTRSRMANVITLHDVMPLRFPHLYSKLDRYLFELFVRTAVRREYRIITVSEFSKSEILELFPSALVDVIVNGTTALPVDPASAAASPPYYLCVGNLKPHKNIPLAIRAFRLAKARRWIASDVQLLVAGSVSGLRQADTSLLQAQSLRETDIKFIESPSDAKLGRLYRDCVAFVAPSLYEGFGLPILEAMHFNKPIICSDIHAFREIAGTTVQYFGLNDIEGCAAAMAQTLSSESMGKKNYGEILQRFTWAQSALHHHRLFSEIYL